MQAASLGRDGALRPEAAGKHPEALTDNPLKRSAPPTALRSAPRCAAPRRTAPPSLPGARPLPPH